MTVIGHSSLDIGARIKSDPDFYNVGTLETIEDMGGVTIARVTKSGRIIPIPKRTKKAREDREATPQRERVYKGRRPREPKHVRIEFNF